MTHSRSFGTASLLIAATLLACGGAPQSLDELGAGLEGIYRLRTHTRNDAACDQEGASILSPEVGYFALMTAEAMGEPMVRVTACAEPDDCREKAQQSRAMQPYWADFEFVFSAVEGAGSLSGDEISTGSASASETDPCYGTVSEHLLTSDEAGVRIEQRSTVIDEFPKDGRRCSIEGAHVAARSRQCSRLQVITAVREADLELGDVGS